MFRCHAAPVELVIHVQAIVSNNLRPVTPGTIILLSIDCQFGFGAGS